MISLLIVTIFVVLFSILIWLISIPDSSSEHWEKSQNEMMEEAIKEITKSEQNETADSSRKTT